MLAFPANPAHVNRGAFSVILTLKEISRFSPPQMSMPESYWPISLKYFLLMANKPPAMVGDLRGDRDTVLAQRLRPAHLCGCDPKSSPDWSDVTLWALQLRGGNGVPLEVQTPVEAAPDDGGRRVGQRVG